MMSTTLTDDSVRIPTWVVDHSSFLRWACSDEFPERGRYAFLNGEVWIDMSPEELYTHNLLKGEYAIALGGLLKRDPRGQFFHDRCLLTNPGVGLSTEPDGLFVSFQSFRTKRVLRIKSRKRGYVGISGSPDMVLEVVSDSSEFKDTVALKTLYWQAKISEYWLVDGRGHQPQFTVLRRARGGYLPVRKQAGWQKSEVFGRSFKLTVARDELGDPKFTLLVR